MTAADLADLVRGRRFDYSNETELQDGLAAMFTDAGIDAEREARLSATDRIDFLVGTVGVEVKIKGSPTEVLRQLQRYAAAEQVTELLLITTRAAHSVLHNSRFVPVPVTVVRPAWM